MGKQTMLIIRINKLLIKMEKIVILIMVMNQGTVFAYKLL